MRQTVLQTEWKSPDARYCGAQSRERACMLTIGQQGGGGRLGRAGMHVCDVVR